MVHNLITKANLEEELCNIVTDLSRKLIRVIIVKINSKKYNINITNI